MIFQGLAERLQSTFKKLRGKGKLTESDINSALREVRMALLEADVSLPVVKDFIKRVRERCTGSDILESLTPVQQIIKVVDEELTILMGEKESRVNFNSHGPTVILLVGLQGSGKTTTAGKLALHFRKQGKRPLLVGADVYRPAAIKQLEVLSRQVGVPCFSLGEQEDPVRIAEEALDQAGKNGCDLVIIDTAGRLHIDQELMRELKRIKEQVQPQEVLLVVDAMTGQDAVTVAESFNRDLALTGLVMTKLDGDARGGAALSVKSVTGCPIKFIGVGEKLDGLEPFHPDRMASRILGMGDMLSLIEKAQAAFDQEKAKELEQKIRKQEFTLDDFVGQIKQLRNMGPLDQILGMIPGISGVKQLKKLEQDFNERELAYVEAMISSMTPEERRNTAIINGSRRKRIARGSGTTVQDVNRLLKQFEQTRKLMKQFSELGSGKNARKLKSFKFPF